MITAAFDAKKLKRATLESFPGMTEAMWFEFWRKLKTSGALLAMVSNGRLVFLSRKAGK